MLRFLSVTVATILLAGAVLFQTHNLSVIRGPNSIRLARTEAYSAAAQARSGRLAFPKQNPKNRSFDTDAPGIVEPEAGPFTVAVAQYFARAWPADEIPLNAVRTAKQAFGSVARFHDADEGFAQWRPLGPLVADYPAILGRTGAEYIASGRITALAIDPNCGEERCRLYVGAAGGGVWSTNHALSNDPNDIEWKFITAGLGSNAVGSLTIDPTDPTGNTIYLGTGEPNVSADSEAGVGIFKSTDGGNTWAQLPAVATIGAVTYPNFPLDRAVSGMVVDPRDSNTLYVALARAVRGISGNDGGATSSPPASKGRAPLGLYKSADGGITFARIWDGNASVRGVIEVQLDPNDASIIYASALQKGLWRSSPSDASGAFQQIFVSPSAALNFARTQFALTRASDSNGQEHTRIYLGDGAQGPGPGVAESQVWRADNADVDAATLLASQATPVPGLWRKLTSSTVGDPGYSTYNYCTGQCWYDNAIATPPGQPDTVFVLGSFEYGESFTFTNARAVLRSKTAGEPDPNHGNRTFTDMTFDATSASTPNSIHPDQHAIVFVPGHPEIWIEGSDGGLMRSSGRTTDVSSQCNSRTNSNGSALSTAQLNNCRQLLSDVPTRFINMNVGLGTIQFQTLSVHPTLPKKSLQGGTQDNGTFAFNGSSVTWKQTGGGDGGFSGYNLASPNFRFRTNFGQFLHGTRKGADPAGWYHIGGPILFSPEGSLFYMPVIYDPNPASASTIFAGSQGVWRSQDNGGDPQFLEANCQSIAFNDAPTCGDFVELGGNFDPHLGESPGDLTSPTRGSRPFGLISVVARASGDTNTLWAATTTGRVFVSTNGDDPNAANATYTRLDTLASNTPPRVPTGIVVDPKNHFHAWISYSGYSATVAPPGAEPNQPGHVFEITYDGTNATWKMLDDGTGPMGDLPVTSIARDNRRGGLYVSTDFGVLWQPAGTTHWHVAGRGLPEVEVPNLTISENGRLLFAATHGLGAYVLPLSGGD